MTRLARGDGHIGESDSGAAGRVEEGGIAVARGTIGELRVLNVCFRIQPGDVNHSSMDIVEGGSGDV